MYFLNRKFVKCIIFLASRVTQSLLASKLQLEWIIEVLAKVAVKKNY